MGRAVPARAAAGPGETKRTTVTTMAAAATAAAATIASRATMRCWRRVGRVKHEATRDQPAGHRNPRGPYGGPRCS